MEIPIFLKEKLIFQYGQELTEKIISGYQKRRFTSFRVNTLKTEIPMVLEELKENEIGVEPVSWYAKAFLVKNKTEKELQSLKCYQKGEIYVQSLSSMIPVLFLDPKEKETILDMTAAPGGKTTQLATESNGKAFITACEKNKIRAERLKYNIEKQTSPRVTVLTEDARKLDSCFFFDKILLDAPCSGSGTLQEKSIDKYSEELLSHSIVAQKELLKKAISLLKKGNILIYSTCSILKEENEEQLLPYLKKKEIEILPISLDVPTLPVQIPGTICVLPTEEYEGFFIAKIRKK